MKKKVILFIFIYLFLIIKFLTGALLIDDFNDGDLYTKQTQTVESFAGSGASSSVRASSSVAYGDYGYSCEFSFENCINTGWAVLRININNHISYTNIKYISFFIRSSSSYNGNIGVGFDNGKNSLVLLSDYLNGGVTTNWQKVLIPVTSVSTNLKKLNAILFLPEWKYNSGSATLYIDNITLGTNFVGPTYIDKFSSGGKYNSLYGATISFGWGGAWITNYPISSSYYSAPYSMKIPFIISNGSGAAIQFPLEDGSGVNISMYDKLVFTAKELSIDGELTNIRIEINDGSANYGVNLYDDFGLKLSQNFTSYTLSLSSFGTPDWNNITYIQFVFWDSFGSTNGTLYLDDFFLINSSYTKDTNKPSAPYNLKVNNIPLSNNFVFNSTNGSIVSALADSIAKDSSLEAILFEYRLINSYKWTIFYDDYNISDTNYSTPYWLPPACQVFDVRVVAMDIYGNEKSSTVYYNCLSGSIFKSYDTIFNDTGGWLRLRDFSTVNINPNSLTRDSIYLELRDYVNSTSLYNFANSTTSSIKFYNSGVYIYPDNVFFNNNISIELRIPTEAENKNLSVYYWTGSKWLELNGERVEDNFGNKMFKVLFNRSGLFILGESSLENNISENYLYNIENLNIMNRIFEPDKNELFSLFFNTSLNDNESVPIKIVDINYNLIYKDVISPVNHMINFVWDGKDINSEIVKSGIYIIIIDTPEKKIKIATTVVR